MWNPFRREAKSNSLDLLRSFLLGAESLSGQAVTVERALGSIREIGYDGAELCLMAGWPSEPAQLDAAGRRRIRGLGLPIPSMITNLNLLVSEAEHARTLDRIRVAAMLALRAILAGVA